MFRLHRWLLDSRPSGDGVFWGKVVVGVSTLLFVFVLVSGVIIWWPRTRKALKNSLKITVRKGWRRFWYGLHVAGGMYVLLLLLVMALTGLTWSFSWYQAGFYTLFGVEVKPSMGHGNAAMNASAKGENGKNTARRNMPVKRHSNGMPTGRKCTMHWQFLIPAAVKSASLTVRPVSRPTVSAMCGVWTVISLTLIPAG